MLTLLIAGFAGAAFYVRACTTLTEPAKGAADQKR
jgi:hypothetical protein